MAMLLLFALVFATVIYFRAIPNERTSPVAWAAGSFALTMLLGVLGGGIGMLLLAQMVLFVVMWWYNERVKR